MYQIGDRVVYGMHGVCDVVAQEEKLVDRKQVIYLVLEPSGQPGSRFLVPTHNAAAMAKVRPMLTGEALEALLAQAQGQDAWIRDEGQRKQHYRELIGSGDRLRLLSMVQALYRHKAEQSAAGRKVHLCDDNFLRDAERLLASEIAMVLGLDMEAAKQFLRSRLRRDL